eukprot:9057132-Alexandrium_andersonii.AAC.1
MLLRLFLAAVWPDDGGPGSHRGIAIRREVERRLRLFHEGRWSELFPAQGEHGYRNKPRTSRTGPRPYVGPARATQ